MVSKLKKKSAKQLQNMMGISADLAGLNHERFQQWTKDISKEETTEAALLFKGEVYVGMAADKWGKNDFKYAQKNVRILSGLYGLLRPLDAVKPYRLEMGSAFAVTPAKKNLYKYWGDTIQKELIADLEANKADTIVNLASNEYSKAALLKKIDARVVTPQFKDLHKGEYKALMFFAKKARGMMADFAVKNKIKNVEDLKSFDCEGYIYNPKLSSENDWVFTRDKKN